MYGILTSATMTNGMELLELSVCIRLLPKVLLILCVVCSSRGLYSGLSSVLRNVHQGVKMVKLSHNIWVGATEEPAIHTQTSLYTPFSEALRVLHRSRYCSIPLFALFLAYQHHIETPIGELGGYSQHVKPYDLSPNLQATPCRYAMRLPLHFSLRNPQVSLSRILGLQRPMVP